MKKRLLSLLLAVLMLASMLPMVALADLTATDITVADATYYATGALKSVNTTFNWQQAAVTGRLVLMTERLRSAGEEGTDASYGDFTDFGYYADNYEFRTFDQVVAYDKANNDVFGILSYTEEQSVSDNNNEMSITFAETDIPLDTDATYYVYFWTYYSGEYYPDNLFLVIQVKDGTVRYTTATDTADRNSYDASAFQNVESKESYSVAITKADNMSKTEASGAETQSGLTTAMTPVVYTAAEGYYFPEDYAVAAVNGIMVRRDSETQITVYGTPAANTAITLAAPTESPSDGTFAWLNDGYPYGRDMSGSAVVLVIDAENATAWQWQATDENGDFADIENATASTLALTSPAHGTWYRCVVNGEASKAVQIVSPGADNALTWTGYSGSYYISNGTMAYRVGDKVFDVTGLYRKGGKDYMLRTSYGTDWEMFSSTSAEPAAYSSNTGNASLDALRVAFSEEDEYAVIFQADLADGQQAFAFGCDTMLGNGVTSGSYSDSAALVATTKDGVLQQVAMIGAASEAAATESDPAFVIAPAANTPASRYWLGNYSSRQAYVYHMENNAIVDRVENRDSGMTMSWLNVPSGGTVSFLFKVGSVADTGAVDAKGEVDNSAAGSFGGTSAEGLGNIADEYANDQNNAGQDIEVKLTVTEEDNTAAGADAIAAKVAEDSGAETQLQFVDLTLTVKIGNGTPVDIGDSNDELLTVRLPFDSSDKENIAVYRFHDANNDGLVDEGEVTALPWGADNANADGEYFVYGTIAVTLHVKKFSTYAIGYTTILPTPSTYPVVFEGGEGATGVAPTEMSAAENDVIVLPANTFKKHGCAFSGWNDGNATYQPGDDYTMPAHDVTFTAQWRDVEIIHESGFTGSSYIRSCTSQCDVCGGCMDLACGKKVCKDKCILLTMDFVDVEEDAWYTEGVGYAYHHGMMNGVGDGLFDINGTTTRAMIVTILWRLEGEKVVRNRGTFADVPADQWYTEAVEWAAAKGIVEGYNGYFDPMGEITNEQLVAILYRYASFKGYDLGVDKGTDLADYDDGRAVSDWAEDAMLWACSKDLVIGNLLAPQTATKRCETAVMLMRFCEALVK